MFNIFKVTNNIIFLLSVAVIKGRSALQMPVSNKFSTTLLQHHYELYANVDYSDVGAWCCKTVSYVYNALNLPQSATISSESSKLVMPSDASRIDYTYDGTGIKHQTVHTTVTKYTLGNKVLTRTKRDTTRYVGSRIYENGQLDRVLTPYGYIKDGVHHTFIHDYQGNVAAVVAGDSLVQRTSYYPYGLPHANALGATTNPYKYSGKEFDTFGGTDLYDFHARYHAPSTGRFMTVDPMAEKYPGISPYMYCAGNPIAYIDPDGMQIFVNIDDMIYYYREIEKGRYGLVDEDGNEYDGENIFSKFVVEALTTIQQGAFGQYLIESLISSPNKVGIAEGNNSFDSNGNGGFLVNWLPCKDTGGISRLSDGTYTSDRPDYIGLSHELGHTYDKWFGKWDTSSWTTLPDGRTIDNTEVFATRVENIVRYEHNISPRTHYSHKLSNTGEIIPNIQTTINIVAPYYLYLYYQYLKK